MHIIKLGKSAALIATLLFANQAMAGLFAPTECPDVAKIQARAKQSSHNLTCTTDACNYNLEDPVYVINGCRKTSWYFYMDFAGNGISAISDAKNIAETALNGLVYQSGPSLEVSNLYACRYKTTDGVEARALYY